MESRSKSIFFSCFLLLTVCVSAQKLTSAEQSQMEKGQLMVEEKNYRMALPVFEDLLSKHPSNNTIKYFTALCYFSRADKHALLLQYLNEVYAINKKANQIELDLAKANFLNLKLDEATKFLDLYTSKNKKLKEPQQKEVDQLKNYIQNAKKLM